MNVKDKMNSRYSLIFNRVKYGIIALFAIFICVLQLWVMIKGNNFEKYTITEHVIVKHNGKKVFEGNIDNYSLKNIKSEDTLTMYMKIPDKNIINPAIIYDNINTGVKLYLDGEKIYSIGEKVKSGGIVCHANNIVALGDIKNKKELVMEVRVMSSSTLTRLPRVKLMNVNDLDKEYFYSMNIYIIIGLYLGVIGVIGLVIGILIWKKDIITAKIIALSIWNINCGIYIISMFQVIPIFSDRLVMDAYIEYSTRLLLILIFNIYMIIEKKSSKKKTSIILSLITGVHFVVAITLQALGIKYLNDTMSLYLIMCVLTAGDFLLYNFNEMRASINKKKFVVISGITFSLLFIYVIVYLFFRNYTDYFLVCIPLALLVVLTMTFLKLIAEIMNNLVSDAKKEGLKKLAYIDKLTGVYNRRGLLSYISSSISKADEYRLYVFDLNGLKVTNDTYGHMAGDELIKNFASVVKKTFTGDFVGRMGGDEFIVISRNKKGGNKLKELEINVKSNNAKSEKQYKISYAVGMVVFKPSIESFDEAFDKADLDMYKMKENIHKAM